MLAQVGDRGQHRAAPGEAAVGVRAPGPAPRPVRDLAEARRVLDVLRGIDPSGLDYDAWIRVGYGLKAALGEHGECVWLAWSRASARHDGTIRPERARPNACGAGSSRSGAAGDISSGWPGACPMDSPDLHAAFDEALQLPCCRPACPRASRPRSPGTRTSSRSSGPRCWAGTRPRAGSWRRAGYPMAA